MEHITLGLLMVASTFSPSIATTSGVNIGPLSASSPVITVTHADLDLEATTTTSTSTEAIIRNAFKDTPILIEIARCESHFRQVDKEGNVLKGVQNSADIGVMQINEKYHIKDALERGDDIYTLEGNISYAKHLYETQGTKPWNYSSKCWDAPKNIAKK